MAATLSDLSTTALIGTPSHNTINVVAIGTWEQALLTRWNAQNPDGTARGTARTDTLINLRTVFLRIAVELANNGTSSQSKYDNVRILMTGMFTGAPAETWTLTQLTNDMTANGVTYRMYMRAYAQKVFEVSKSAGLAFRIGLKAGTEDKYAYAAFEGSIYVKGMSTHERAAADAATQILLARSAGGATRVNDAVENTKGVIGSGAKTVMF